MVVVLITPLEAPERLGDPAKPHSLGSVAPDLGELGEINTIGLEYRASSNCELRSPMQIGEQMVLRAFDGSVTLDVRSVLTADMVEVNLIVRAPKFWLRHSGVCQRRGSRTIGFPANRPALAA